MARRAVALWLAVPLALALACGASPHPGHGSAPPSGPTITLYRDVALVQQHVEVDVPEAGSAVAHAVLAAGVTLGQVEVLDRDELTVSQLTAEGVEAPPPAVDAGVDASLDFSEDDQVDGAPFANRQQDTAITESDKPVAVVLQVHALRAGHYTLTLAYAITTITWDTAYTMTTTPARGTALARGAIAIRNAGGIAFPGAHVTVIDDALRTRADGLTQEILRAASGKPPNGDPDTHPARVHDLGRIDIADGEVRAELYAPGETRALRSVLVYDPIGTKLDNAAANASRDENIGVLPPAPTRIEESVEIARDPAHDLGLPGGPARLVERQRDGSLVVLAEGRMFDAPTRVATFDTIALGVAHDVIGHRARREFDLDEDRGRLTEDFTIELDNQRAQPVQVVMREHMYRSANWALGFYSVPVALDGTQEISLRAQVPAKGKTSVMYAVVYWWDEPK